MFVAWSPHPDSKPGILHGAFIMHRPLPRPINNRLTLFLLCAQQFAMVTPELHEQTSTARSIPGTLTASAVGQQLPSLDEKLAAAAMRLRVVPDVTIEEAKRRAQQIEKEIEKEVATTPPVSPKDMFETSAEYRARQRRAVEDYELKNIIPLRQKLEKLKTGIFLDMEYAPRFISYDADLSILKADISDQEWMFMISRDRAKEMHGAWGATRIGHRYSQGKACPFLLWMDPVGVSEYDVFPPLHECLVELEKEGLIRASAEAITAEVDRGSGRGTGVSAPVPIHKVAPEYSKAARKAKLEGTVLLAIVVDIDGTTRNIRVLRSLGMGLDEKAIEAVSKWRFRPGYKEGKPVPVQANVELSFRFLKD